MIDDFKGKTAVLTGAGSGFGLECARIGARLGMNLVLADVQQDALDAAAAELRAAGATGAGRKVDVSSAEQMEALAPWRRARSSARRISCSTTPAWARAAWCGKTPSATGNGCWASTSGA
jgi:NAD(P)-dependent dehydrogenase (short-subunit alcohol dehydrogenase family)